MAPFEDKSGGAHEPLLAAADVEAGSNAQGQATTPRGAHGGDAVAGNAHSKRPLTLLPLIALIFIEVSGGPFGTEVS